MTKSLEKMIPGSIIALHVVILVAIVAPIKLGLTTIAACMVIMIALLLLALLIPGEDVTSTSEPKIEG